MKRKEVRWISRDRSGRWDFWKKKPHKARGTWWGGRNEPALPSPDLMDDFTEVFGIDVACGGLAKVTIKRQY